MSFFNELKRRNVVRVAIAYAVAAWVLLQIADLVLENIAAPPWVIQVMMLVILLGFIASVVIAWAYELTPEGVKRQADIDSDHSITAETGHKLDRIIIGFLALAVAYFVYDKFVLSDGRETAAAEEAISHSVSEQSTVVSTVAGSDKSIAVLPFVNMSEDAGNEYFSDGISEELLNVLVRVKGLRVPSRTSSFTFKGSDKQITEIGKALKVDHVLEGSVRKAGNRIRVTAQLIEVNTDTHLWSETYTRDVDDIFAVQDEIAQAIVSALKITLSYADEKSLSRHGTDNVEAYNDYLLGRHLWNLRTKESLLDAIEPLKKAVALDPQYEQVWAALADTYALIPEYRAGPITEFVLLAQQATDQALAINPDSARALTTRAYLKAIYDYDFVGANADFSRAIELEPNYATGHQWYAEILSIQRRHEEAIKQINLARDADPMSAIVAMVKGTIYWNADRLDDALLAYQASRELDPLFDYTMNNMQFVYALKGDYANARLLNKEVGRINKTGQLANLALINAMENPALKDHAIEVILQLEDLYDGSGGRGFLLAILGEHELAIDNFEKAFAAGDPYATNVNVGSMYEPLRDNPRFQAFLAQMNLWP